MKDRGLKIYLFCCSNSSDQEQLADYCRGLDANVIKVISLPCSGKVDIPYLVKAFETGADGVVIVSCKENECRHIEGDIRARNRVEAVDSLLEEIGVGTGRIAAIQLKDGGVEKVACEIKKFCARIKSLPQLCVSNQGT